MMTETKGQLAANVESCSEESLDRCTKVLEGVQDQVKFADGKAGFVAALNALLFGFASSNLGALPATARLPDGVDTAFVISIVLLGLYIAAAATSVVLVVLSVASRFGEQAPQCKVFFGHIAKQYGRDYAKYAREVTCMDTTSWADEVCGQIVEVSNIASAKHKRVKAALWFTLAAFMLWIGTSIAFMFLARP